MDAQTKQDRQAMALMMRKEREQEEAPKALRTTEGVDNSFKSLLMGDSDEHVLSREGVRGQTLVIRSK